MTPTLPDDADAWARAWRERLNDSADFAAAAGDFAAAVLIAVRSGDSYDGDPVALRIEVADGECVAASAVDADTDDYDYALCGPYEAWKSLLRDELDVSSAVMGGPFDVEGNTLELMTHREAFTAMVGAARGVDVEFAY